MRIIAPRPMTTKIICFLRKNCPSLKRSMAMMELEL